MTERDNRACLLAATPMPPSVTSRLAAQLAEQREYGLRPAARFAWLVLALTAGMATLGVGLRLRQGMLLGMGTALEPTVGRVAWLLLITEIVALFGSMRVLRHGLSRIGRAGPMLAAGNVLLMALAYGATMLAAEQGAALQPRTIGWMLGLALLGAVLTLLVITLPFRLSERLTLHEVAVLDLQREVYELKQQLGVRSAGSSPRA